MRFPLEAVTTSLASAPQVGPEGAAAAGDANRARSRDRSPWLTSALTCLILSNAELKC